MVPTAVRVMVAPVLIDNATFPAPAVPSPIESAEVVAANAKVAPVCIVSDLQTTDVEAGIVNTELVVMVTSSAAVGTTPPVHIAVLAPVQLPVVPFDDMAATGYTSTGVSMSSETSATTSG